MRNNHLYQNLFSALLILLVVQISTAQAVGINTDNPANGAALDITSTDRGFLMPRVALTGTDDVTTITPAATTGLMVYNTVTAGALPVQVTPGFYYWDSTQWRRLYNQGYTLLYDQESEEQADTNSSTWVDIPDLDTGDINIPFSGTYQIITTVYYSAGDLNNSANEGAGNASIKLSMRTNSGAWVDIEERYVTSTSHNITGFQNVGQQVQIIHTVELDVINTYRFRVQGREWQRRRTMPGYFGMDTDGFSGSGSEEDAQRGSMTVSLVKMQ